MPIDDLFLFVVNFLATVPTRFSYLLKKQQQQQRQMANSGNIPFRSE